MYNVKSIVIDIDDNWGDASYVGLHRVELLDQYGSVIPLVSTDFTASATSTYYTYRPNQIFDTSLSKTSTSNSWWSALRQNNSQRVICIFNNEQNVYGLKINNIPSNYENLGAKNIRVYLSTDNTQTLTYNAIVNNHILIFDDILPIHVDLSIADDYVVFNHSNTIIKLSSHGRQFGDLGQYPLVSGCFDTRLGTDANTGTLYVSPTNTTNYTTTGIVGQNFLRKVVIKQYRLYITSITNTANPNSWTFEGYNGTDWVVLDTQTNQYSLFQVGWNNYTINNYVGYTQYRMNVTANGGHLTQLHIVELEFIGYDAVYRIAGIAMTDNTPIQTTVRVYNNITGKYIGQLITQADGSFNITGLPTNDTVNVVCLASDTDYNDLIYRVIPVLIES